MAAEHKRHFWEKLLQYLPPDLETKLIPVWRNGRISVREALWQREFYHEVAEFRPDLLLTDYPLTQARHLAIMRHLRGLRCRYAIHLRGDIWTEVRLLMSERRAALRRHLAFSGLLSYLQTTLYAKTLYTELRSADIIMPICRWLDGRVHEEIGDDVRTDVVYQGVDPSLFFEEKGLLFRHPNVGIMQSHNIYPKVKALIEFRKVMERMPNVTFYVVEGKPGKITGEARFSGQVKDALGTLKNVTVVPSLPYPDGVRRFLSACDVYVLATNLDACPTTVLEASLVGRPVVASKVGGVPELIVEGKTGFCIDNDDIQKWVQILTMLVDDTRYARQMGSLGREFVSANFDWRVISRKLVSISRSLA
jgi:glycosyltransferase involved in cell wall biosynthesis